MKKIDISIEVNAELERRRQSFDESYDTILRRILGIDLKNNDLLMNMYWKTKEIKFPEGTKFKMEYKGQVYYAEVLDCQLQIDGKSFNSFSHAAFDVVEKANGKNGGVPVNGWRCWYYQFPKTKTWTLVNELRKK